MVEKEGRWYLAEIYLITVLQGECPAVTRFLRQCELSPFLKFIILNKEKHYDEFFK